MKMNKTKQPENIVHRAIKRAGTQGELARRISTLAGHPYKQQHIAYWKKTGQFPAILANLVASEIFGGEITAHEACPSIKRAM